MEWCIKAASAGSLDAMLNLADKKYEILDLPVEPSVAFPWYLKAAEAGHYEAQWQVIDCYRDGIGVQRDRGKYGYWTDRWRDNELAVEDKIIVTETSLHRAIRLGDERAVRLLIGQSSRNVDVEAKDGDGNTALSVAVKAGHIELARLLVSTFGANVNAQNNMLYTPLHIAMVNGHFELAMLLVREFHADVDAKDLSGFTPMHRAAESGHVDVVRALAGEFHAGADCQEQQRSDANASGGILWAR